LFLALLFLVGWSTSNAQVSNEKKKFVDKFLSDIIRTKRGNKPFVLLTPKDLSGIPTQDITEILTVGDPCDKATPISIGQATGGALSNTDCRLDDNSYADFYIFNGNQGQQVTVFMNSSSIDSYLGLANESGTFTVEEDDSGGGLSARISATLPQTGLYIILANSALLNEFRGYTLRLSGAALCTYSVSPTTADIPAIGGTFSFTINTQPECHWQAVAPYSYITTNSTGIGTGTVTYTVAQNGSGAIRNGSVRVGSAPLFTGEQIFNITQPSVGCTYSLSPTSVNIPATQTTGSFSIIAPAGCPWTVQSNSAFVSSDGSGTGNGTITYNIAHNNGAARVETISVGGQTFTINQEGLNCTYAVTPIQINVGRSETNGTVTVNTQPGCTWMATRNQLWIEIQPRQVQGREQSHTKF